MIYVEVARSSIAYYSLCASKHPSPRKPRLLVSLSPAYSSPPITGIAAYRWVSVFVTPATRTVTTETTTARLLRWWLPRVAEVSDAYDTISTPCPSRRGSPTANTSIRWRLSQIPVISLSICTR